ncbi:hypothetical protein QZH41_014448 [Actinostola sp. cb2023]|nr:hypothetical protein QZH41_014448 [Actinostola sp. cb2023]
MNSTQKQNLTDSVRDSSLQVIISPFAKTLLVAVLAVTTVAVFLGNTLVLIILHKQKKTANQRVITMFIANLSLIDLSVSLIVLPLSMATYIHGSWPFGETFCAVNGFTTMVIGISGILSMMAIAIDSWTPFIVVYSINGAGE